MKTKKNINSIILLFLVIGYSNLYAFHYHYNDKNYRRVLLKNNVLKADWTFEDKNNIPEKLRPYAVPSLDKKVSKKRLFLPLTILKFKPDNSFIYLWKKTNKKVGYIRGEWKIENNQLILTLKTNHAKPYLKGSQLRYEIIGGARKDGMLQVEGRKYHPCTGIVTTSIPLMDMKKIVIADANAKVLIPKMKEKQTKDITPEKPSPAPTKQTEEPIKQTEEPIKDKPATIKMSKDDSFTFKTPDSWKIDIMQYQPMKSAQVLITPKVRSDFNIILHFRGEMGDLKNYDSIEKIKQRITESVDKYLLYAVENKVTLNNLPNGKNGFYAVLTDKKLSNEKNIPKNMFKLLVKGIFAPSNSSLMEFTLMTNTTKENANILKEILAFSK